MMDRKRLIKLVVIFIFIFGFAFYRAQKATNQEIVGVDNQNIENNEESDQIAKSFSDPCGYIGKEDIVSVLGTDQIIKDDQNSNITKSAQWTKYNCIYESTNADKNSPESQKIVLTLQAFSGSSIASSEFEATKKRNPEVIDLSGPGSSAFWIQRTAEIHSLSSVYTLAVIAGRPGSGDIAPAQRAIEIVLKNLKR